MYRYRYRGSPTDDPAEAAAGGVILATLLAVLLLLFLAYKAASLVGRTIAQHPRNLALWIALGACGVSWCLAAAFLTQAPQSALTGTLVALAGLTTLALVCTAHIVELYYDNRARRPVTKETLIADVLSLPWWRSPSDVAAAA